MPRNGPTVPTRAAPQPSATAPDMHPVGSLMRNNSASSNKSLPGLYMHRQMSLNNQNRSSAAVPNPPNTYFNPSSLLRNNRPLRYMSGP